MLKCCPCAKILSSVTMMALSSISPSTFQGSPLTMIINPYFLTEKLSCTYYVVNSHCEYDIGDTHVPFSKSPEWNLGLGGGLLGKQSFMKHQVLLLQVLVPTEFSSSPGERGFSPAESSGEEAWSGLQKHCLNTLLAGENGAPSEASASSLMLPWHLLSGSDSRIQT